MLTFRVPFEHRPPSLEELLTRAWPEATTEEREQAIEEGCVHINDIPVPHPEREPRPEAIITADIDVGPGERGIPESEALARGEDWAVVNKPVGMAGRLRDDDPMHPIRFMADRLGLDREGFLPVWSRPSRAGGPWLFGTSSEAVDRLRKLWFDGALMTTWLAIVPRPDVPQGMLRDGDGLQIQYSATTMRNGLCELQLTPSWEGNQRPEDFNLFDAILQALADAGWPVLGDRWRAGYMVAGSLRLQLGALYQADTDLQYSWPPPDDWWPADPVVTPPEEEEEAEPDAPPTSIAELDLPALLVDASTIEALRHSERPWIPSQMVVRRRGNIEPGTLVRLRGTNDVYGPVAITDALPDVAARIWSDDPLDAVYFDETVAYRLDEAIARRADLMKELADTDLFRLVHGEADGLPGMYVDRVGPLLRCILDGAAAFAFKERVYDLLVEFDEDTLILEVEQTGDFMEGKVPGARIARSGSAYVGSAEPVVVRDGGIRYLCSPWQPHLDLDPAHRTTRRRLADAVTPGSRWMIATPPATGLPVVAAVRGAEDVVFAGNPAAPDTLEESIVLNGHDTNAADRIARGKLRERMQHDEPFDGVACNLAFVDEDHPTSVVEWCLDCLSKGGRALLYAHPFYLPDGIEAIDALGDVDWEPIGPPSDFPDLPDFPERTPFTGAVVTKH